MRGRLGLAVAALACALGLPSVAVGQSAPHHVRIAFSARALATPFEPAPGANDTEVAFRPAATLARAFNPPVAALARASTTDLGLAETLVAPLLDDASGGQARSPSADADTQIEGDDDVTVDEAGSHLEARADESPKAEASADGAAVSGASGSVSSKSFADGSGPALLATSEAEVNDLSIGPLVIGSGRFEGMATIDGTPRGAAADGLIEVSDATFGGVPVVIGANGLRVDEERVPAPLVDDATATIQEIFSPGGFADIRVVQPNVTVAGDGRSASVTGGGVRIFMTSNDPTNNYFFAATLLRGSAEVFMGADLSVAAPDSIAGPAGPLPAGTSDAGGVAAPTAGPTTPTTQLSTAPPSPEELAIETETGRAVVDLWEPWPYWPWLVAAIAALWATAGALRLPQLAGARARVERLRDELAERFLRG